MKKLALIAVVVSTFPAWADTPPVPGAAPPAVSAPVSAPAAPPVAVAPVPVSPDDARLLLHFLATVNVAAPETFDFVRIVAKLQALAPKPSRGTP